MVLPTTHKFTDGVTTAIVTADGSCFCVVENNTVSLPYSRVTGYTTYHRQCNQDILEATGVPCPVSSIFRVYKIWLPGPIAYVNHLVFLITVTNEKKKSFKSPSGKFSGRLKWIGEHEMTRYYQQDAILSSVIIELFPKIPPDISMFYPAENEVTHILTEVAASCLVEGSSTYVEIVIDAAGMKPVQNMLYKEFMAAAFPYALLSLVGFSKFMSEQGIAKEDIPYIFYAADFSNRRFLSFRDFISVISVLEPATNHGGLAGEIRCRYIFRFFDRDRDGSISMSELKEMITYMRKLKGQPVDSANVEKEFKAYSASLNMTSQNPLSMPEFLKQAGELKIRGLSQVLRFPKSFKAQLQNSIPSETKAPLILVETLPRAPRVISPYTKFGTHEIAVHTICVKKSGTTINLDNILSMKDVVSHTTLEQANINRDTRRLSLEINTQGTLCNELIKSLRYLVYINQVKSGNRGNSKEHFKWGLLNKETYGQRLIEVATGVSNILKTESRLLDIKSPVYIMGDLHGNFGDLQYFERMFWPLCPGFCPSALLFLGDYVDRGSFGIEIITYLFCYKLLYPHKINLIRGNHEIREIQKAFTFYSECFMKFGDKLGYDVWESINQTFDVMPIAAVVDGNLFCCHGGVPPPWLCPVATAINNIPVNLSEPDLQSTLAWEIMWNDPIKQKQITPELDIELKHNEGFAANARRGTAHIFNCDGLERFLNVNGFSHVIRAHEVAIAGYSILLKGKLITVFSSSNYNNQNNNAACILVDNGKMRMMRLDPHT